LDNLIAAQGQKQDMTIVGKAMEVINKDYGDQIDPDELAVLFDVMANQSKAYIFVGMGPSAARDAWVRRQIALDNVVTYPRGNNLI
jgi:hypothetical protein